MVNIFSNNLNYKNKNKDINYPCVTLGQKIYVPRIDGKIDEEKITKIEYCIDHWVMSTITRRSLFERDIGSRVFLTEQEASEYIKLRNLKKLKKRKMQEFEKMLNEELGLNTIIIR